MTTNTYERSRTWLARAIITLVFSALAILVTSGGALAGMPTGAQANLLSQQSAAHPLQNNPQESTGLRSGITGDTQRFLASNLASGGTVTATSTITRTSTPTVMRTSTPTITPSATMTATSGGAISGNVYISPTIPLSGALVYACWPDSTHCSDLVTTDGIGHYTLNHLVAGQYTVTVFPPASHTLAPAHIGPLTVPDNGVVLAPNLVFDTLDGAPPGTYFLPDAGTYGNEDVQKLHNDVELTLYTTGCPNAEMALFYIYRLDPPHSLSGSLTEIPTGSGNYQSDLLPPFCCNNPNWGGGWFGNEMLYVQIWLICPDGDVEFIDFYIYIDPSGHVRTVGGDPLPDSTVTLYRSDSAGGPFVPVPNGSAIMSPANRTNPDTTGATGHFGWDVVMGYYKVRAEHVGCTAPNDPNQPYVESAVLPIPPPVTDLDLRLLCPSIPTSTATATPTATSSPTPVVTPTVCPLQFQDLPPGSTFYSFVRCMACSGIINGYTCGGAGEPCVPPNNYPYYRPNNNVTRGQIAKIVSNAAGLQGPVSTQTFEDVPSGSTFHLFVERLASLEVIGGYACGGAGEPCVPPDNKPYFRPNGTATRGQLSKIVCRAYGCAGAPSGQTFEDVPPSHTFYEDIEHLYALGAISGYGCGGASEPCLPPDNRPYFRPGANVSRGQTAKIVTSVFFLSCDQ
jgi:hypothetical protein